MDPALWVALAVGVILPLWLPWTPRARGDTAGPPADPPEDER